MSQSNFSRSITRSAQAEKSDRAVSYRLVEQVGLRRWDPRRARPGERGHRTAELVSEFLAFEASCVARGKVGLPDMRQAMVLQAQIDRGERAARLLSGTAPADDRMITCAALAHWLYATGGLWTQQTIAHYLNDRGQTTRRGRACTQGSVSHLLRVNMSGAR